MSLTLLYPVRLPPFYFPSVSDRWVGVGLLGLLEPTDPVPGVAPVDAHVDAITVEVQDVRGPAVP